MMMKVLLVVVYYTAVLIFSTGSFGIESVQQLVKLATSTKFRSSTRGSRRTVQDACTK